MSKDQSIILLQKVRKQDSDISLFSFIGMYISILYSLKSLFFMNFTRISLHENIIVKMLLKNLLQKNYLCSYEEMVQIHLYKEMVHTYVNTTLYEETVCTNHNINFTM